MRKAPQRIILTGLICLVAALYQPAARSQNNLSQKKEDVTLRQGSLPSPPRGMNLHVSSYRPSCRSPTDGEEQNVCTGMRQAQAAEQANDIAKLSLRWNRLSVGVIAATLLAAIAAAVFGGKAARHTERSADAAGRQVRISEETAQRQLRAYMVVDMADVHLTGGQILVTVRVRNVGATPAYKVSCHSGLFVGPDEQSIPDLPPVEVTMLTLGRGVEYNLVNHINADPTFVSNAAADIIHVFAFGRVEYEDIFGIPRFLTYRLIRRPELNAMMPCIHGNSSDSA